MGMGNNPHYVVKMHSAPIGSSVGMRFEHPCQAGGLGGGWMEREYKKKEEEALAEGTGASKTVDEALLPAYTLAEVEKHDSYKSAWFTHDGKVRYGTAIACSRTIMLTLLAAILCPSSMLG